MSGSSQCRSCGRPIVWATHITTGKNMPIDPDPVADGNLVLVASGVLNGKVQFRVSHRTKEDAPDLPGVQSRFRRSHFVTCPDAKNFRRRS